MSHLRRIGIGRSDVHTVSLLATWRIRWFKAEYISRTRYHWYSTQDYALIFRCWDPDSVWLWDLTLNHRRRRSRKRANCLDMFFFLRSSSRYLECEGSQKMGTVWAISWDMSRCFYPPLTIALRAYINHSIHIHHSTDQHKLHPYLSSFTIPRPSWYLSPSQRTTPRTWGIFLTGRHIISSHKRARNN